MVFGEGRSIHTSVEERGFSKAASSRPHDENESKCSEQFIFMLSATVTASH